MPNIARRLAILALFVLLLMALGLCGFWLLGAERLRGSLTAWEQDWRARGGEISHDDFRITGFPMWFRAEFDHPVVGWAGGQSPWRWRGPPVRMRASPFAPRAQAQFPGRHQLFLTVLGAPLDLNIEARTAVARFRQGGGETRYGLHGTGLDLLMNGETRLSVAQLDGEILQLRGATDHLKPSWRVSVELDDVMPPAELLPEHFRAKVDVASLQADVMGPFRPAFNRAAASAWRDLGGTVEITSLELRWGALTINAVGTMALDDELQPLAALTATVTGFNQTIDALRSTGAIQQREADAAKALLNLLAKSPRLLGGQPELSVPITIQNQRLSLGPIALFTVPRIDWPN